MPKLWSQTVDAHRRDVREAILDTTAALVLEHGLRAVTMSQIAERTGIGRATLYKYFPDVEAILVAWHQREVGRRLAELAAIRDRPGPVEDRLRAVLAAYAEIARRQAGHPELSLLVHGDEHAAHARQTLTGFLRDLLVEGAAAGVLRDDVAADELAAYCLHALGAAGGLSSRAAVRRLVTLTLAGLRPPR